MTERASKPSVVGAIAAWACLALGLSALLTTSCSSEAPAVTAPDDVRQLAPGTGGAPPSAETPCTRLLNEQADSCRIAWICPEAGRHTFVCFNEPAASGGAGGASDASGMGCGCMIEEQFSDAFTLDLSACGDDEALAALARDTCGWDVP